MKYKFIHKIFVVSFFIAYLNIGIALSQLNNQSAVYKKNTTKRDNTTVRNTENVPDTNSLVQSGNAESKTSGKNSIQKEITLYLMTDTTTNGL